MKIIVSENVGELNFGVSWISLDGRLQIKWFTTYNEAKEQFLHLKGLKRQPSLSIHIEPKYIINQKGAKDKNDKSRKTKNR